MKSLRRRKHEITGHRQVCAQNFGELTYPMAQQVVCVSKGVEADFREYYAYKTRI